MDKNVEVNGIVFLGKEAIMMPCLAIIGAAGLISAAGYGLYKLGKNAYIKATRKEEKES